MPELADGDIDAMRAEYAHCFGCGPDNPMGLRLRDFVRDESTVSAIFVPRPEYRGFAEILHGGVIATALDEILAWTAILVANTMVVTGRLDVRFRKPAPADATYRLEGALIERRGKRLILEGSCRRDDAPVATARGLFLASGAVVPTGTSPP